MSEDKSDETPVEETPPALPTIGWVRRASKQVESAGAAFKKIGMRVKLANKLDPKKKKKDPTDEVPRKFTFDPSAVQRGASICDLFESDEVEEDFNDVVDLDDERVEEVVSQDLVGRMVDSFWFRGLILGVIVMNAILIGAQTNKDMSQRYAWLFFVFDHTVLSIFVAELLLKWYNGFTIYWKVGWNILDFCIIVVLLLGPALTFLGSSRILRILRVLRAFRGLRNVSALTGLSVVVQTVFQSIPDMTNIALLLIIIMVVLSVVGVFLFGEDFPGNFGNLQAAMFSLFICVTQDGWVGLFEELKGTPHYVIGAIYFILAIVIGAFVFANLVVAVVVTNLDKAVTELKHENKMREDLLGSKGAQNEQEDGDQNRELPITSVDEVAAKAHLSLQKPLFFGDFEHLTTENFQNYIVLISALEENLAEYKTIKEDLDRIIRLILELNEEDEEETEEEIVTESSVPPPATPEIDIKTIGRKGDILSNLLELEQYKVISSRRTSLKGVLRDVATKIVPGTPRRLSRDVKAAKKSKEDMARSSGSKRSLGASESGGVSGARSRDQPGPSNASSFVRSRPSSGNSSTEENAAPERSKSRSSPDLRSNRSNIDRNGVTFPHTVIRISPPRSPSASTLDETGAAKEEDEN